MGQEIVERPDRVHILENFHGKILLLAGRHDNAIDPYKMLQCLPNKNDLKAYLLDCGHNGHWEKPNICAEIIKTELG